MSEEFNPQTELTPEDLALARAEHALAQPDALNMQLLQGSLGVAPGVDQLASSTTPGIASGLGGNPFGFQSFSAAPADLQGFSSPATSAGEAAVMASAMSLTSQVAGASPAAFGIDNVGQSATLNNLGGKVFTAPGGDQIDHAHALAQAASAPDVSHAASQFMHLLAGMDTAQSLMPNVDLFNQAAPAPTMDQLNAAIDSLTSQINALHNAFDPVMPGLNTDAHAIVPEISHYSPIDLNNAITHDSGLLQSTVSQTLSSADLSSPSLTDFSHTLLNPIPDSVHSVLDPIVHSVTSVTDPVVSTVTGVTDTVTTITDPVLNGVTNVTDPVLHTVTTVLDPVSGTINSVSDPVAHLVGGVTDPISGTITTVTNPIVNTITGVTQPITDTVTSPITNPVTTVTDPVTNLLGGTTDPGTGGTLNQVGGVLGTLQSPSTTPTDSSLDLTHLSSGISSTASGTDSTTSHLLSGLDPHKPV